MTPVIRIRFALIALVIAALPLSVAHAQLSSVDVISNNSFENSATALGFEAISQSDGSVAHTTTDPITGTGSLKVTVNSYGRVVNWYAYGYGAGPYGRSITFSAKLRVDSTTIPGRQLTACAIAYFFDSQDPSSICEDFPVNAQNVVDVNLALDTNNRQLQYVFPQFKLDDTGTIEATVDDAHLDVVEAEMPPVPSGFERVELITNNGFDNSATALGFEPFSPSDGSVAHTTSNPIIGDGSMSISLNSYGRISNWLPYGYGAGPFARSVTLTARVRVDSSSSPGQELTVCTVAYFFDSQDPSSECQNFPVDSDDVDVYLLLDTEDRQLQYVFPQFSLNDSGTIEATVDSVHFYVVQPQ